MFLTIRICVYYTQLLILYMILEYLNLITKLKILRVYYKMSWLLWYPPFPNHMFIGVRSGSGCMDRAVGLMVVSASLSFIVLFTMQTVMVSSYCQLLLKYCQLSSDFEETCIVFILILLCFRFSKCFLFLFLSLYSFSSVLYVSNVTIGFVDFEHSIHKVQSLHHRHGRESEDAGFT